MCPPILYVVVLRLYVICYKILSSYELIFVMTFCIAFLDKLVELKVNK